MQHFAGKIKKWRTPPFKIAPRGGRRENRKRGPPYLTSKAQHSEWKIEKGTPPPPLPPVKAGPEMGKIEKKGIEVPGIMAAEVWLACV